MKPARKKSESGNAILEFAIGWTVLWFVFTGVYQFGYGFYVYDVLQTAVANAAELGSKMTYDTGNPSAYQTALQNMVVYGDETSTGLNPIVPGLTTANVTVVANPSDFPTDITVSVTGYKIDALFTTFSLNNKPRGTVQFYGQVSCSGKDC
jgi:Flp pilus assembly protein TadG